MNTTETRRREEMLAKQGTGTWAVERTDRPRRRRSLWPVVGLAAVGLGLLAWYSFGPDLKRYMKIRNM